MFESKHYLQATCIMSAAFSRSKVLPTFDPVAPAIRNAASLGSSTIPFLEDGLKSGKQDKTPCNAESIRKRVTFKCSFSLPAYKMHLISKRMRVTQNVNHDNISIHEKTDMSAFMRKQTCPIAHNIH